MEKTSIVERFRALRWETALPAPDDDVATRRQKREDLERALEVGYMLPPPRQFFSA